MLKDKIVTSLHKVQREDPFINELSGSIGLTLDNFDESLNDFKQQLDIDTATWGLSLYEKELNIPTDESKPIDERRSVIKGKIRGAGKIGAAEIELVAESWTNGEVEVSFDGAINVKFVSEVGTPTGIDDLKKAIGEIKPAHLRIIYTFRYLTIADVESMTIVAVENTLIDKFAYN